MDSYLLQSYSEGYIYLQISKLQEETLKKQIQMTMLKSDSNQRNEN